MELDEGYEWRVVEVDVPPGPLGILLDGKSASLALLEGFAPINAEGDKGAVELQGEIAPGAVLIGVSQYDFEKDEMSFIEVGKVLRETSHLQRILRFKIAVPIEVEEEENQPEDDDPALATLSLRSPGNNSNHSFHEIDESEVDAAIGAIKSVSPSSASIDSATKSWSAKDLRSPRPESASGSLSPKQPTASPGSPRSVTDNQLEEGPVPEPVKFVTIEAPPGSLGMTLDANVMDCAVVAGFVPLADGSKGPVEENGGVVPGSVLTEINGKDVSTMPLGEIYTELGNTVGEARTLVFRLPPPPGPPGPNGLPTVAPIVRKPSVRPTFVEDLTKRRSMELKLVMKYDATKLSRRECWFLIDAQWMSKWIAFAARGGPLPGPITNENLLAEGWEARVDGEAPGRPDEPRQGLEITKDYRAVPPMIWCLLLQLHGAGRTPPLARFELDLYAEPMRETEITAVLVEPRLKATTLVQDLRERCRVQLGG
ncbi:hypothetical protein Poli38472_010423 [Pythium oligandrum]|uniref:DUSP domain-containing protein n=1 Tax=Pythium oligandrum TaxID=41045 RepID=A0A8K1C320_PYTOL|nr:hypothetical protein Poli38472_010423 [Pythium oligandrum]|eukprot:TMW55541.1 hypothetical protein Poli38472_010423 [Pythium oligandrum]